MGKFARMRNEVPIEEIEQAEAWRTDSLEAQKAIFNPRPLVFAKTGRSVKIIPANVIDGSGVADVVREVDVAEVQAGVMRHAGIESDVRNGVTPRIKACAICRIPFTIPKQAGSLSTCYKCRSACCIVCGSALARGTNCPKKASRRAGPPTCNQCRLQRLASASKLAKQSVTSEERERRATKRRAQRREWKMKNIEKVRDQNRKDLAKFRAHKKSIERAIDPQLPALPATLETS